MFEGPGKLPLASSVVGAPQHMVSLVHLTNVVATSRAPDLESAGLQCLTNKERQWKSHNTDSDKKKLICRICSSE